MNAWLRRLMGDAPPPRGDAQRLAEVEAVLREIAALVAADGGRIELRAVDGGEVVVALRGACESCHASDLTLQGLLEPRLRERLEWFSMLRVER
ncbi:MAG TPA: NifU family protein [Planctomycetota bacterium]|nr:NifU family protein [Planctomycetota bacterium]